MAMRQTSAFGALLKRYRQAAGLTQEALAEQAGLSTRAISDLERGLKVRPHKDTVALLAAALQLTPPEHAAFVAARQGSVPPAAGMEVLPFVGRSRTLLLLDDLQWAGPDALALLASLLHADAPLRVIGAYRDSEVQAQDVLASTLGDLAHAGLAAQHALGPLAPADAARLLEELMPEEGAGDGAQRERVVQRAGGVPFVLVSYAQALRTHLLEEAPADAAVPWDVAQGVRQRVAALSPLAQELLDVATVLGRQAPRSVLQGVVAQPEEALVAAMEQACQARLLEEEPEGYRFAHDVIGEVLEGQLSEGRRLLLHRRVAEVLEAG